MIYGTRIEQARKLSGLTQKQLASQIGKNQSAIAHFEKDISKPSDEILKDIASFTGVQISFFQEPPVGEFPKGSLTYRSLRSMPAREEEKVYQYGKLLFEHVKKMSTHFSLPSVEIAKLRERPAKAAEMVRVGLGLSPDLPISNLVHQLEKNGVIILSLPFFSQKMDAFSTWVQLQETRPLIATILGKPGDRLRFSIAHEVGHLVMHYPPKEDVKLMEKESDAFAAELLMPRKVMEDEFIRPINLYSIAKLKMRWGVSMAALIYRARDLRKITERQAKYLFMQMSIHGWEKTEPSNLSVKIETPQIMRDMLEKLYDSPEKYAQAMHLGKDKAMELSLHA